MSLDNDRVVKRIQLTDDELTTILRSMEHRMGRLNVLLDQPDEVIGVENRKQMKKALKKIFLLHNKLYQARADARNT